MKKNKENEINIINKWSLQYFLVSVALEEKSEACQDKEAGFQHTVSNVACV